MQPLNECVSGIQFTAYSYAVKRQLVMFPLALQVLSEPEYPGTMVGKANKLVKFAKTGANRLKLWTEHFSCLTHTSV